MNDLAREVLVKAALDGVRQAKGTYRTKNGALCAFGVLFEAMDCQWLESPNGGYVAFIAGTGTVMSRYDISQEEAQEIIEANDKKGWDFLTIARKIGNKETETE